MRNIPKKIWDRLSGAERDRFVAELRETERQRAMALAQRDEYEAGIRRLKAELAEVEAQRDGVLMELEQETNFLKYRCEELSRLHERVVLEKWSQERQRGDLYCTYPFERIEILPQGEVYTCCSAWLMSDYYIGNIFEQDFDEIWNSERAKRLRYSVSCGEFEYCHEYCRWLETARHCEEPDKDCPVKKKDGRTFPYKSYSGCIVSDMPKVISLSCDVTCNLYCASCRKERKVLSKVESDRLLDVLMKKVRPMLKTAIQLELLGSGEVFASAACLAFLKSLDREEFPTLNIGIVTNAQLFDEERWAQFDNLRGFALSFAVSIDGADRETYEANRRGAKWETLQKNMVLIARLRREGYIKDLTLNFVVQKNNYMQMPDFVTLAEGWGADTVNFQYMTDWGTMTQEEYAALNVFHPDNPECGKALEILKSLSNTAHDVKVSHNIPLRV